MSAKPERSEKLESGVGALIAKNTEVLQAEAIVSHQRGAADSFL
jgi:hypothetical protein